MIIPSAAGPDKIAMLGTLPPIRGLSSYCLELTSALVKHMKVNFISFNRIYPALLYPGKDLSDDPTFPDLRHRNLRMRRNLNWYNPLSWILEGLRADGVLLHAQWWSFPLAVVYAPVCLGFKCRKRPVIFTVHNVFSHEESTAYREISRMLFALGDHFIVHSASNREQLVNHYGIRSSRVAEIPHGPLDFHVRNGKDRTRIRGEMGFQPTDRVILLFGAIRPYKGVETALKAFRKILNNVGEARLLIAGKLWADWTPYDRLIEDLRLRDFVKIHLKYIPSEKVHRFFSVADLVILPYLRFEAQSGVGATAVSFRKPLVVSSVGGLHDLVEDKRFVVPPGNEEALACAVVDCLKDPLILKKMSENMDKVADRMSWSSVAQKTLAVYRQVLMRREKR